MKTFIRVLAFILLPGAAIASYVPGPIQVNDGAGTTTSVGYAASNSSVPVNVINTVPVSGTVTSTISGNVNVSTSLVKISDGVDVASVTTSGAVLVDGSATTQPISGTVTATQSTGSNLRASVSIDGTSNTVTATQTNGANLRASVSIDGTSNTVSAAQSGSWSVTANQTNPASLRSSVSIDGTSNTVTANQGGSWTVAATQSGAWAFSVSSASVYISGSSNTVKFDGSTATVQGVAQQFVLPTAVSTGAMVPAFSDKFGRFMVSGIPREQIKQATATVTSTTEFVFISSGATGVYNDLCGCLISNTSSTSTRVDFRGQGNGGTINTNIQVPGTDVRGFWPGCQNPMVQLSAASNWTVQISTAVTDMRIACQYIPMK